KPSPCQGSHSWCRRGHLSRSGLHRSTTPFVRLPTTRARARPRIARALPTDDAAAAPVAGDTLESEIVGRPTISATGARRICMDAPTAPDARAAEEGRRRWQRRYDSARRREADFTTLSGLELDPVYGPPPGAVVPGFERIGWPGESAFTRGLSPQGTRARAGSSRQSCA